MAETQTNMGDAVFPGAGSVASDPLGDNARARIKGKRKRQKSAFLGADDIDNPEVIPSAQTAEQLAKYQEAMSLLLSPKSWERVICSPFDMALMMTGAPEFNLPEDARQEFGVDASLIVQFWGAGLDPKYLVLLKTAGDFASVGANCWLAYKTRMLAESLARQEGLRVEK